MCGIAGIIGNINNSKILNIKRMTSMLTHRGPDKQRILKTKNSLLAFTRLKIIDFDDRSMQPMISSNRNYVLLFNGEIYNYKELRKRIGKKYNFITKSDTEVLLAMMILYGKKCLKEINGMFSFCFFDKINNTYTIVRDRFGQKPLYYCTKNSSIYFASEIKALLSAGISNSPNIYNISEYIHMGKIDCTENTWFKSIYQLKAGELLEIKNNKNIKVVQWYNLDSFKKILLPKKIEDKKRFISEIFLKVCEEHLNSDTKIGIKLSGGLDSSSLLASLEKNKKYLSNDCFSVDFGSKFSEKDWIYEVANYFNKTSHIKSYYVSDFLKDFERLIYTHESPLGGLMNCAFEKVYKNANDNGIRVLLDGTGLDEAFGGYRIHHLIYLHKIYKSNNDLFKKHVQDYSNKWEINTEDVMIQLKKLSFNDNFVQDGSSFNQINYTTKEFQSHNINSFQKNINAKDNIQSHLIDYILRSKIPKNTRIKDRQSMSHSIELRMPFLDHRIIELGLSLDEKYYFDKGFTKSIVRSIMKNKLPDKVRLGQKRSIQAPQSAFLKNSKTAEYILDLISSESFKKREIFDANNIKKNYKHFLKFGAKNTFHIWQWINVEKFFQIFVDNKLKIYSLKKDFEIINL